ncbi:MAG: hypothetical protein H8E85_02350 [Candidatus Marinimicrobia bacterium]|nr:hypothetical protein [Candidatus Neomarinimicrobiota bacterium]
MIYKNKLQAIIIILLFSHCDLPVPQINGCMDKTACNYDEDANEHDESCLYAEDNYDCFGICVVEVDCNDECAGTAWISDCGCVAADNLGDDCDDCAGEPNGNAEIKEYWNDEDGDGLGNGISLEFCNADVPDGWVLNNVDVDDSKFCPSNEIDDCDVCDGGNSDMDCAGKCFGEAYYNECNICIDNSQEDFDYYDAYINLAEPDNFITELTDDCKLFYDELTDTMHDSPNSTEDTFIFKVGDLFNNHILISAPHSQRNFRYGDSCYGTQNEHCRDKYTGAIAQYLHILTDCSIIISKNKSDDPNYYDKIPENTQLLIFGEIIGETLPYKQKIKDYLNDNEEITTIIDLHGFISDNLNRSNNDIEIGTMDSLSLNGAINHCIPHIIEDIFIKHNVKDIKKNSSEFAAISQQTVTKYITNELIGKYDAIQMEVESDYRGCEIGNQYHLNFINAMIEIIYVINKLSELNNP